MKYIFLAVTLFLLLAPVLAAAQINLNLDYPEFGNITLDKTKCEQIRDGTLTGKICGQNLNTFIAWLYYLMVGIAGLAAFIMLIWGGIQWLTSGAIPSQAGEARDKLRNAALGLLLILASFLIVQTINPQLTILNQPGLEKFFGSVPQLPQQGTGDTGNTVVSTATDPGAYLCKQPGCTCVSSACAWTPDINDPDLGTGTMDALYLNPSTQNIWCDLGLMHDLSRAFHLIGNFTVTLTKDTNFGGEAICFDVPVNNLDDFNNWSLDADSAVVADASSNPCADPGATKPDIQQALPTFVLLFTGTCP